MDVQYMMQCLGGKHSPDLCYFKKAECHACHKKGHIARACKTNPECYRKRGQLKPKERDSAKQTNNIEEDEEKPDDVHNMFMVKKDHNNPIVVELTVEKEKLRWKSIQEKHCSSLVKLYTGQHKRILKHLISNQQRQS
uniref:CCHC-type domain-containing protein n=1 Tax=Amphimedon queenslandica TaxID=400682 RepID=A0A1X7SVH3_AMPQE